MVLNFICKETLKSTSAMYLLRSAAWPRGLKPRFYGDRVITIA